MSSLSKGLRKVEVALKWDPSPAGTPANDLDIVATVHSTEDPHGEPAYVVHYDSRSPDGTINLNRDSQTGQGFGFDEVMTLEFYRLAESYTRVVVGVVVQQPGVRKTFGEIASTSVRISAGYDRLAEDDFSAVSGSTAAVVAEFARDGAGEWKFHGDVRGFDVEPDAFTGVMSKKHS